VRDTEAVKSAVREAVPDVVFHLASAGVTNPALCPPGALMVNVGGAVNLLEALRGSRVQRVVLVGTSYEYGARQAAEGLDPMNAYAASKVAAWAFGRMYWRAFELPTVTVRPFQVYGPGQPKQTLVPAAMSAALSGRDFPITPGEQQRDFIYVEDVAEGMIAAAEAPDVEGESLDLGTGIGNAIRRVVERIWRLAGGVGKVEFGALPYRSGDAIHLIADADRTAQLTGWRAATPLAEGLRATLQSQRLET
jgi:nucleoside-diphosphate-sugar epimerase